MMVFHGSVTQQSAITRWWESFLLLGGNLEHILGISLNTRLSSRKWALPFSALGPQTHTVEYTRGTPHRITQKQQNHLVCLERKYLPILGRFLGFKEPNCFLPITKYYFKDISSSK